MVCKATARRDEGGAFYLSPTQGRGLWKDRSFWDWGGHFPTATKFLMQSTTTCHRSGRDRLVIETIYLAPNFLEDFGQGHGALSVGPDVGLREALVWNQPAEP